MTDESQRVKTVFLQAVEIPSPRARATFLEKACGSDVTVRQRVEALLSAHERPESLLDTDAFSNTLTVSQPIAEKPGDTVGPYKLLEQIGEGGFGVVFMAEQEMPVRRRIALKIIKPGMDSRQVVARFEAERQALAIMDHPNIAKVFDAGTTDHGRPYFVMELVNGVPLTDYCDQQRLTPRQRLELFFSICQAVQHAHQKGIIHRDIKPSNVLVAEYDDRAVPKIIDFGVAKAINQQPSELTQFTQLGQLVGTIEYMSPEQAQFNPLDVDTRTDIYSLGVLLYELLTGQTPIARDRLRSEAFDEILRIIRQEEPARPSVRLSTSASLPSIAANRRVEPRQLAAFVHGELDWIVMTALEKDRTRRYDTASKLAEDVQHFLDDEPVEACPPSAAYRCRKFARRNKAALSAGAAILLVLIAGIAGTTWQAVQATRQRNRAIAAETLAKQRLAAEQQAHDEAMAVSKLLQDAIESANPEFAKGSDYTVRQLLNDISAQLPDRLRDQPAAEAAVRTTIGKAYRRLGLWNRAEPQLKRALEIREQQFGPDHVEVAGSLLDVAYNMMAQGELTSAEATIRRAIGIHDNLHVRNSDTAIMLSLLQMILLKEGRARESETAGREALAVARQLVQPTPEIASILSRLSYAVHTLGDDDEAEQLAREAVTLHRQIQGNNHPDTAWGLCQLGFQLSEKHEYEEAEACLRESMEIFSRQYGDISYAWQCALEKLVNLLKAKGDRAGLEVLRADVVRRAGRTLRDDARDGELLISAASSLLLLEEVEGATEILSHIAAGENGSPKQLLQVADQLRELGTELSQAGRFAEAETSCLHAFQLYRKIYGYEHADAVESLQGVVTAIANQDRSAETERRYRAVIDVCSSILAADMTLAEAWALRGECYRLTGDFAKMAEDYSQAIKLCPDRHWYWHELAYAHLQLGENDKSIADHTRAIALSDDDVDQRLRRAQSYESLGQLDRAEEDCRRALELTEYVPIQNAGGRLLRAHVQLLSLLTARGDREGADALLTQLRTLCSQLLESQPAVEADELEYAAWALATHPISDPVVTEWAVKMAEAAWAQKPGKWDMNNTLGAAYCRARNWEAAIENLHRAREIGGLYRPAEDGYLLALAYANHGQHEQARRWFDACDRWVAAHGGNNESNQYRAEAATVLGLPLPPLAHVEPTPEEVQAILRLFAKADPDAVWIHASLGQVCAEQGDWNQAADQFTLARERRSDSSKLACDLAIVRLQQADEAGYREICQSLIPFLDESTNARACDRLAWTCGLGPNTLDDLRTPLQHAEARVAKYPADSDTLRTLGALLYRTGQYDHATQRFEESIAALGNSKSYATDLLPSQLLLAMTKWQQGQRDEARQLLDLMQAPLSKELARPSMVWTRRATLELIHREADALIRAENASGMQEDDTATDD